MFDIWQKQEILIQPSAVVKKNLFPSGITENLQKI